MLYQEFFSFNSDPSITDKIRNFMFLRAHNKQFNSKFLSVPLPSALILGNKSIPVDFKEASLAFYLPS